MRFTDRSPRQTLMLAAACSLLPAAGLYAADSSVNLGTQTAQLDVPTNAPGANGTSPRSGTAGVGIPPSVSRGASEQVIVKAQRLLLKEKNSPSAVTELGSKQIDATGITGSTATLLRQAPSVYVYQQGLGYNSPELTIRGLRGVEVATTLDDFPMQDLIGSSTQVANIGNRYDLTQISGVSIYPGVAYPDKNTFGTIGGTVAYQTKRPTNDQYLDVTGTVGSFGVYGAGFEYNSGGLDGIFGSGDNAPKLLLNYNNLQTQGYIDYTPARYNSMEFAFDKPFDDGLSKFQATVLYNTASGVLLSAPTPLPLLQKYGLFNNYPTSTLFESQSSDYLTILIKAEKYINDVVQVGLGVFYLNSDQDNLSYANPALFNPNINYTSTNPQPFTEVPAYFYAASSFGPGSEFYAPGYSTYNPAIFANNPKYCPAVVAPTGECGLNAQDNIYHNDTYGIQPHVTIIAPEIFGIANTIKLGGLVAKETEPTEQEYIWGTQNVPHDKGYNEFDTAGYGGGQQRTIMQAYIQDKIDLLDNTLHITPGGTLEGTFSSDIAHDAIADNAAGNPVLVPTFKLHKFDRDYLPFFNTTYDLDKVLPALRGTSFYGSFGKSAIFAPGQDFQPSINVAAPVPSPTIVLLYEGGVKYNTSNIAFNADYFYQKIDRDYGFFEGEQQFAGLNVFTNDGQREFKGIETAITWQATPHWQFFFNGSYLLAKYLATDTAQVTVGDGQFGIAFKGNAISGIPSWLSTFGVDYENKSLLRDNDQFSARLTGQYTGEQHATYDIPAGVNIPGFTYAQVVGATATSPTLNIGDFTVFNLLLSYTLPTPQLPLVKHVKFDLNIQNLFDRHYFSYYYSQIPPSPNCYYCAPAYENGLPGEPFGVNFTMTARF